MDTTPIAHVIGREPLSVTLQLQLDADFACFDGHFPGFPVLAGVVQLDWALQLAAAHLGVSPDGGIGLQVKHRRLVVPSVPLVLDLRLDPRRRKLQFVYRSADVVVTEGSVTLVSQ